MPFDPSDTSSYRNPFTLLGLKPEELDNAAGLKKARQRLLAEAGLSDDGVYTKGNVSLNRYEIEQLFAELDRSDVLGFYISLAKCPDFDRFLSGSKDFSLKKILDAGIWHESEEIYGQAMGLFEAHFSRNLKNAVIGNRIDELKNLTRPDIEEYDMFDPSELFAPTMHYLEGVLSDLRQCSRETKWLNYSEPALWDFVYANFSPDTLNLLPDEFYQYRDDMAVALLRAARRSYLAAPQFFNTAQKIAFKFKLSERGKKRAQTEILETANLGLQHSSHQNQTAAQQQTSGSSIGEVVRILFFGLFFIVNLVRFCGSSSSSSHKNTYPEYSGTYSGRFGSGGSYGSGGSLYGSGNSAYAYQNYVFDRMKRLSKIANPNTEDGSLAGTASVLSALQCYDYTYSSTDTKIINVALPNSERHHVIYVRGNYDGEEKTILADVFGIQNGSMLWPKTADNITLCIAVGDKWSNKVKNPCSQKGYVDGKVKYYINVIPDLRNNILFLNTTLEDQKSVSKAEFLKAIKK